MNDGQIHREVNVGGEVGHLLPVQEGDDFLVWDADDEPPPLIESPSLNSVEETASSSSFSKKVKDDAKGEAILDSDDATAQPGTSTPTQDISNAKLDEATSPTVISADETVPNNFDPWVQQRSNNLRPISNNDDAKQFPEITNVEPNLLPEIDEKSKITGSSGVTTVNELQPLSPPPPTDKDDAPPPPQPSFDENDNLDNVDSTSQIEPVTDSTNDWETDDDAASELDDEGEDGDWEDLESDATYSLIDSDDEGVYDLDLDELNLDVLEQVAEAQIAAGGQDNVQLILNLQNENDLQEMLGMLGPVAGNANLNNIQLGFILDGVIDIQAVDAKRSRWVAVEDDEGHLTYTLKISID